jgi:hypothetical protein
MRGGSLAYSSAVACKGTENHQANEQSAKEKIAKSSE